MTISTLTPWRDISDPRLARTVDDLEAGLGLLTGAVATERLAVGPVRITVDTHRLNRYLFTQDLIGDPAATSHHDGATYVSPAILANDLLQLYNVVLSASKVRGLHAHEELWFHAAVRVGEVVTLDGRYVDAYERRGQVHVVFESEARGEDGRLLMRRRGAEMLAENPGVLAGRSGSGSATVDDPITGEVTDGAHEVVAGDWSSFRPGARLPERDLAVTFEQAAVYSRIGEYVHNVHNSLAEARDQGLRVPVVQGQQQVTFLADRLVRELGDRWTNGGHLTVKFLRPTDVFETVRLGGVVVGRDGAGDAEAGAGGEDRVRMHLWLRRADGALNTVAWAECGPTPVADGAAV